MPSYETALPVSDQQMLLTHTTMWLIFKTDDPDLALRRIQDGLDRTVTQLPYLSGDLWEDAEDSYRVKIKWSDEQPKVTFREFTAPGLPSFDEFTRQDWDINKLPLDMMPKPQDGPSGTSNMPALIGTYTKLQGGLIVLLAPHHVLMDGGGREILFKLWATNTRGDTPAIQLDPKEPLTRTQRLNDMVEIANRSIAPDDENIWSSHELFGLDKDTRLFTGEGESEAEKQARLLLAQRVAFPANSRLVMLSVRKLEALRVALRAHTKTSFSLNTMVSVLLWVLGISEMARRLKASAPDIEVDTFSSIMAMAVNSRKHWVGESLLAKDTWAGNLATSIDPIPSVSFRNLSDDTIKIKTGEDAAALECPAVLPNVIDEFSASLGKLSLTKTASYFAMLQRATTQPDFNDFRKVRDHSRLFNGISMMVTNWGALDLLQDFGAHLGRPCAARVTAEMIPPGLIVMMPRHRDPACAPELQDQFDLVLGLHQDDVQKVVANPLVQSLMRKSPA